MLGRQSKLDFGSEFLELHRSLEVKDRQRLNSKHSLFGTKRETTTRMWNWICGAAEGQ